MSRLQLLFHKQNLRRRVSKIASYTEIFLALVILFGIMILSVQVIGEIRVLIKAVFYHSDKISASDFLSPIFGLVIGIEFVKMLLKHTPESAIEVLLYTIARKLIADHGSMVDAILGVSAIAILFAVRKYLNDPEKHNEVLEGDYVVNGGTSLKEVNKRLGSDFDIECGNTVAGYLVNYLKKQNKEPTPELQTVIGEYIFEVYEMDNELIRLIKIAHQRH